MTPLELLAKWGFCPFCVASGTNGAYVRATYKDSKNDAEAPQRILTRPVELVTWLAEHMTGDFSAFDMNGYPGAFVPVVVIGGVPLCPAHLWDETNPATRRIHR